MTGEFRLTELADARELGDEMARVRPAEVLVSEAAAAVLGDTPGLVLRDGYAFLYDQAHYALKEQFQVQALDGFGCAELPAAVCAAGALVHYLRHELRRSLAHVRRLTTYHRAEFMVLDAATQANLELVESRGSGRDTSLLGALDRTKTPMGGRRLRDWVLHPLCNVEPLLARQEAVGSLIGDPAGLQRLRDLQGRTTNSVFLRNCWNDDFLRWKREAQGQVWVTGQLSGTSGKEEQKLCFAFRADSRFLIPFADALMRLLDS